MKKVWLKILSIACCIGALFSATAAAAGTERELGSIEVLRLVDEEPVENTRISLYRVADFTGGRLVWTAEYAGYHLTLDPRDPASFGALAGNLAALTARDNRAPLAAAWTGEDGKALFPGLDDGLYLITGDRYEADGYYYDPVPVLVSVPYVTEEQTVERAVCLELKHSAGEISGRTVNRRVLKVWDDAGHEASRPDAVTVQLLNAGGVVDTQVLSARNDWRFTWTGLAEDGVWTVAEYGVPEGYSVSVREEGVTFVVTNTWEGDAPAPPGPNPGTGGPEDARPPAEDSQPPVDVPENPIPGAEVPGGYLPPVEETRPPVDVPESSIPGAGAPGEYPPGEGTQPPTQGTQQPTPAPGVDIPEGDVPLAPGLPQTGQPWMPVVLCSGLGIACILTGLVMRRRESADEA